MSSNCLTCLLCLISDIIKNYIIILYTNITIFIKLDICKKLADKIDSK